MVQKYKQVLQGSACAVLGAALALLGQEIYDRQQLRLPPALEAIQVRALAYKAEKAAQEKAEAERVARALDYVRKHVKFSELSGKRHESKEEIHFRIENTGTKTVIDLSALVLWLDSSGKAVHESTFYAVSSEGFGGGDAPLRPGYRRTVREDFYSAPENWSGKYRLQLRQARLEN